MRRRVYLICLLTWAFSLPLPYALAAVPLQQQYLDIYLKINDAEHLEKQGDFRGALDDFKDCYAKLSKIHQENPDWEKALVLHRMDDCKAKILDLQSKVDSMPDVPQPPPAPPTPTNNTPPTTAPDTSSTNIPDDVNALKKRLQEVEKELQITKDNLRDSQGLVETYRAQLSTVNQQLQALKTQQSVDDRVGKLLSENKALTDKLSAAQKQLDSMKTNPKSNLAKVQAQLKNLQDEFDESQSNNKTLQQTITNLQQHLDQAQADLVVANQKLAAAGPGSAEYTTIKRENEVMRDILTRELQEQTRRDAAKRLAQEEYDNLKLKSKVLQEQIDILGSPMTPPTTDEERALLSSMKVSGPDVTPPPNTGNSFAAPAMADNSTNGASATPPATSTPDTSTSTNTAVVTPPTPDTSTNQPSVTVVTPADTVPSSPASTPTPDSSTNATVTPTPPSPPSTTPDTSTTSVTPPATPTPSTPDASSTPTPAVPPTPTPDNSTPATPPATTTVADNATTTTTTDGSNAVTTVTDTTIKKGGANNKPDATQYSTKARLPDDMRDTAQQAADLFKNQRYDEAAAKYQSIIDKYPESLYAWSNLGVVRFQQGDLNDALKALQQAVKLSPTDDFSYSNLGIVYYQLGQYENAIDALNSAKALNPNDAKTHNYLGCACSQKGWQEVAEKEFRKAIELDPNFGDAHFNLALVYATEKPPLLELARQEYKKALDLGIAKDERLEKLLKQ